MGSDQRSDEQGSVKIQKTAGFEKNGPIRGAKIRGSSKVSGGLDTQKRGWHPGGYASPDRPGAVAKYRNRHDDLLITNQLL